MRGNHSSSCVPDIETGKEASRCRGPKPRSSITSAGSACLMALCTTATACTTHAMLTIRQHQYPLSNIPGMLLLDQHSAM